MGVIPSVIFNERNYQPGIWPNFGFTKSFHVEGNSRRNDKGKKDDGDDDNHSSSGAASADDADDGNGASDRVRLGVTRNAMELLGQIWLSGDTAAASLDFSIFSVCRSRLRQQAAAATISASTANNERRPRGCKIDKSHKLKALRGISGPLSASGRHGGPKIKVREDIENRRLTACLSAISLVRLPPDDNTQRIDRTTSTSTHLTEPDSERQNASLLTDGSLPLSSNTYFSF